MSQLVESGELVLKPPIFQEQSRERSQLKSLMMQAHETLHLHYRIMSASTVGFARIQQEGKSSRPLDAIARVFRDGRIVLINGKFRSATF